MFHKSVPIRESGTSSVGPSASGVVKLHQQNKKTVVG